MWDILKWSMVLIVYCVYSVEKQMKIEQKAQMKG